MTTILAAPEIPKIMSCSLNTRLDSAINMFILVLIGSIMGLRTLALYNRSNIVLAIIVISLGGQVIAMVIPAISVDIYDVSGGCTTHASSSLYITVNWWYPLGLDTALFGMTLYKILQVRKAWRREIPLIHLLLRDGIFYYVAVCFLNIMNLILWKVMPDALKLACYIPGLTITTTMISRLVLNLQGLQPRKESVQAHSSPENSASGIYSTHILDTVSTSDGNRRTTGWLTGEQWNTVGCPEDSLHALELLYIEDR